MDEDDLVKVASFLILAPIVDLVCFTLSYFIMSGKVVKHFKVISNYRIENNLILTLDCL